MKKRAVQTHADFQDVVENARALLSVTTDAASEKVAEARERLSAAIEKGRETWDDVQKGAVEGVKATDEVIREHPYQAIAIAFGLGALFGLLVTRRH